jgi:hypothetical protein
VREICTPGSVRGAAGNRRPYRDSEFPLSPPPKVREQQPRPRKVRASENQGRSSEGRCSARKWRSVPQRLR